MHNHCTDKCQPWVQEDRTQALVTQTELTNLKAVAFRAVVAVSFFIIKHSKKYILHHNLTHIHTHNYLSETTVS